VQAKEDKNYTFQSKNSQAAKCQKKSVNEIALKPYFIREN
jgi:hypothetical protein